MSTLNIKSWKKQFDDLSLRVKNDKDILITLIKTRANEIFNERDSNISIGFEDSEFCLTTNDDKIVAYDSGPFCYDLIKLNLEELLEIGTALYDEKFEVL